MMSKRVLWKVKRRLLSVSFSVARSRAIVHRRLPLRRDICSAIHDRFIPVASPPPCSSLTPMAPFILTSMWTSARVTVHLLLNAFLFPILRLLLHSNFHVRVSRVALCVMDTVVNAGIAQFDQLIFKQPLLGPTSSSRNELTHHPRAHAHTDAARRRRVDRRSTVCMRRLDAPPHCHRVTTRRQAAFLGIFLRFTFTTTEWRSRAAPLSFSSMPTTRTVQLGQVAEARRSNTKRRRRMSDKVGQIRPLTDVSPSALERKVLDCRTMALLLVTTHCVDLTSCSTRRQRAIRPHTTRILSGAPGRLPAVGGGRGQS